eukprot:GHRR01019667.1.p2 GENE.GHRR01019667.1~~GHRR01019667.1.p2  ORF type:complete len:121 (+),score=39.31 GHRR01019667.1:840-1202(+)
MEQPGQVRDALAIEHNDVSSSSHHILGGAGNGNTNLVRHSMGHTAHNQPPAVAAAPACALDATVRSYIQSQVPMHEFLSSMHQQHVLSGPSPVQKPYWSYVGCCCLLPSACEPQAYSVDV